jgi:uncharacterized membrane protein (DUF4010 family)
MLETVFIQRVVLAIFIGALLGLEREYSKKQEIVGLRTFSLVSLLGAVTVFLSDKFLNDYTLTLIGFLFICIFSFFLYAVYAKKKTRIGFTTNISLIITYVLGVMTGIGLFVEAIFLAVVVAVILYSRRTLHHIVKHLTEKELEDLLAFLILLGIIYPIIPQNVEVLGIVVPLFTIWLLVVLISIINFIAFVISRHVKIQHKVSIISFLGGLIGSTATSLSLTGLYRKNKKRIKEIVANFYLLNSAMLLRNFIVVIAIAPMLLMHLALPAALVFITLVIAAFVVLSGRREKIKLRISSPFKVMTAMKFGMAVIVLFFVLGVAQKFGSDIFLVAVFFSGMASSLSTSFSIAELVATNSISVTEGAIAFVFALIASMITNCLMFVVTKNTKVIRKAVLVLIITSIVALISVSAVVLLI